LVTNPIASAADAHIGVSACTAASRELVDAVVPDREATEAGTAQTQSDQPAADLIGVERVTVFDLAYVLVREAVDLLRDGGRLGYLPRMLTVLGIVSARLPT
jgi:hypothetical protein